MGLNSGGVETFGTLEQAGYEKGDYLPVWSSYGQTSENYSTTSANYQTIDLVTTRFYTDMGKLFPHDNMQPAVAWHSQAYGNGRTGSHGIRIYDGTAGTPVAEGKKQSGGWKEFSINQHEYSKTFFTQIKSGTGGKEFNVRRFTLLFGVKI